MKAIRATLIQIFLMLCHFFYIPNSDVFFFLILFCFLLESTQIRFSVSFQFPPYTFVRNMTVVHNWHNVHWNALFLNVIRCCSTKPTSCLIQNTELFMMLIFG